MFQNFSEREVLQILHFACRDKNVIHVVAKLSYFRQLRYFPKRQSAKSTKLYRAKNPKHPFKALSCTSDTIICYFSPYKKLQFHFKGEQCTHGCFSTRMFKTKWDMLSLSIGLRAKQLLILILLLQHSFSNISSPQLTWSIKRGEIVNKNVDTHIEI